LKIRRGLKLTEGSNPSPRFLIPNFTYNMSMLILERRLNIKNYTVLVRDFQNSKGTPEFSEIRVFDRESREMLDLHRAVHAKDRVDTIKEVAAAARAHLTALKRANRGG
jgi:hypothetical protein